MDIPLKPKRSKDANLFIKIQQLGKEIFMSPCRILYELSRPDKID